MADQINVTQVIVEVANADEGSAKVTQIVVETASPHFGDLKLSQMVIEVASPNARRQRAFLFPANTRRIVPPPPRMLT